MSEQREEQSSMRGHDSGIEPSVFISYCYVWNYPKALQT
jgi:hypothetical protein